MDIKTVRKRVWVYTSICLVLSNILWCIGYSVYTQDPENSFAMSVIMLTSFIPALLTLAITKINKEGWQSLPIHPHPIKAWKIYVLSILFHLLLVYMADPLYLLLFNGNVTYSEEGKTLTGWLNVGLMTGLAIAASVEMLGEELGWMGYLFPKLERLHGTKLAIVILGCIRALWHVGILFFMKQPIIGFFDLLISNIMCQCILVYLTKKSKSVFPAAVGHGITMLVPVFLVYNEEFRTQNLIFVNLVGQIPALLIGGFCFYLLHKEKLIEQKETAS